MAAASASSPPHLRLSPAEKNLVEALAGAFGACTATWLFYPLDTLKTRLQAAVPGADGAPPPEGDSLLSVWRHLMRTEGPRALYRGLGVKTAHSVLQSFVYFYAFATLRGAAEARTGGRLGVAATLAVGTLAGWCNVLITEPLDTIATTKQISRHRSQVALAAADGPACAGGGEIAAQAGPAPKKGRGGAVGLYRSLWVSLLLTCNPALQFTAFDQARRRLLSAAAGRAELSAAEAFVLGAASKALATALTYPAIRAKVLMQTLQGVDDDGGAGGAHPPGLLATARRVARVEGAGGLYRGLRAQLLKTVLVAALQLMVKEKSFGAAYLAVAHVQGARLKAAQRAAARRT